MTKRPATMENEGSALFRSSLPGDFGNLANAQDQAWYQQPHDEAFVPRFATCIDSLAASAAVGKAKIVLLPEDADGPIEERSYATLYAQAKVVARQLMVRGVRPKDHVLLVLPTSYDFLLSFWGVQIAGAVPVPTYPPALMEKAQLAIERTTHIAKTTDAVLAITNKTFQPLLGEVQLRSGVREMITFSELSQTPHEHKTLTWPTINEVAFIQFTSGSTGTPKGVVLSHANVMANAHAMGLAAKFSAIDVGVSWLPLYHDMGLIGSVLSTQAWGMSLVLMSPMAFLMRPSRWLWAIHNYKGTISSAPNFAYAMCCKRVRPAERVGLDLSSWRLAFNGAEPISMRSVVDFHQTYAAHGLRDEVMFPVYGLAEASLAVTYSPPDARFKYKVVDRKKLVQGHVVSSKGKGSLALVSVGKAVPGHQVRVVDANGREVDERHVGHIIVRGPSVMMGYYKDKEQTAKVVRNGWLWTGDLGFISNGGLYITGRVKDLIIVRGRNFYSEDIERVAERTEGVRPGGSVAFALHDDERGTDVVVVVCEVKSPDPSVRKRIAEALLASVQDECGLTLDEVVIVLPGTIPKTSSGKRQRDLCRQLYLDNALKPRRTGTLGLAMVFVRSQLGLAASATRRWLTRRPPP